MKNGVKLTYDSKNQRFQKIVKGKRFVSSRGLLPTETAKAIVELEKWLKDQQSSTPIGNMEDLPASIGGNSIKVWATATPKNQKHDPHIDEFLIFKKAKVSNGRFLVLKSHIGTILRDQIGQLPVDGLDRHRWESMIADFNIKIENGKWSTKYCHDLLVSIRGYFNWLYQSERIDLIPRFVSSQLYTIKIENKQPEFFSADELQKVFKASNEKMKIWYLLALNCGMTQIDISEMTWDMIDLNAGTLTRRRTKHQSQQSDRIPTVVYKLFPELVSELGKLTNRQGRVFTQANGKPLVQDFRNDQIAKAFREIKIEMGVAKSFKHFRKTGCTWIAKAHRDFRNLYLANVPSGMAEKHYDGSSDLPVAVTDTIRGELIKIGVIRSKR